MNTYIILSDTLRKECPNTQCLLIKNGDEVTIELREENIRYQVRPSEIDSDITIKNIVRTWKVLTSKE